MMDLLPHDVLANVLCRLPPRSLVISRCVCSAWRALIDCDGMLLPRSLSGLLVIYYDEERFAHPMLFARPGVTSDDYAIPPCGHDALQNHCNGLLLLLYEDRVVNPATGRSATLPKGPNTADLTDHIEYEFLAFDPAVSPSHYYEVVRVPYAVPEALGASEWPPSPWVLTVFSSATGLWERRPFARRGEPAAAAGADLAPNWWGDWRAYGRAEYWRGALYVHCETNFVMRISLSDSTYRVIRPPRCFGDQEFVTGRSEKGIYSAFLDDKYHLWIWTLDNESCDDDQIQWKLRPDHSGRAIAFPTSPSSSAGRRGPWILYDHGCQDQAPQQVLDQEFEWNSDDDDDGGSSNLVLHSTHDTAPQERRKPIQLVAFHPYREIVIFHVSETRAMAYHLSSSKLEDLGELFTSPPAVPLGRFDCARYYAPFTPCYMGDLPEKFKQTED